MITRLVKMTFLPSEVENFKAIFEANKSAIANFTGCLHVELQRDVNSPEVFFTISKWDSVESLERYRNSELFKGVWGKVKVLFETKAEAWTLRKID